MGLLARGGQQTLRQQAGGQLANPRPPYATGVVHHESVAADGTVTYHHQRFDKGLLMEWQVDESPGPWSIVRSGGMYDPFDTSPPGPAQIEAVKLRIDGELIDLPPMDDFASRLWDALPRIPDATARMKYEFTGSPAGNVAMDVRFIDGKRVVGEIVDDWPELVDGDVAYGAPELHVVLTWRNYLRLRAGEVTALEAVEEGGSVDARWTHLLMLHGLTQEPEYVMALRGLPVLPPEIGWWGEVAPYVTRPEDVD